MIPMALVGRKTGNVKFILALGLAVICTTFLVVWLNRADPDPFSPAASLPSDPKPVPAERNDERHGQDARCIPPEPDAGPPSATASGNDLERIKAQQADAARAAIPAKPINSTVSGRPGFVSELEWEVLQDAVGPNPEMDKQLTHLVNKLLFFKKRKAWMTPATDTVRRRQLARELLAMIPAQVRQKAIEPAFADKMENDLQHYLDRGTDDGR